jgi:hypothetical protein
MSYINYITYLRSTSLSRNFVYLFIYFNMFSNLTKMSKPKRDRINENFSKCATSLLEKGNKLTKHRADVYLLIRRNDKL